MDSNKKDNTKKYVYFSPGERPLSFWTACPFADGFKLSFVPLSRTQLQSAVKEATVIIENEKGEPEKRIDPILYQNALVDEGAVDGWEGIKPQKLGGVGVVSFSKDNLKELMEASPPIGTWVENESQRASLRFIQTQEEAEKNLKGLRPG